MATIALFVLAACGLPVLITGLDYPADPVVPKTAAVVATDSGRDDDDPMRAHVKVIDIGETTADELIDFYRSRYTEADGWAQLANIDSPYQALCLARRESGEVSEFLEVFPYAGSRLTRQPGRYLVMTTRFGYSVAGAQQCGAAQAWIPADLV